MKSNILDLSKYRFTQGESIVFDTNIWLFLFPFPSPPKQNPSIETYRNSVKAIFGSKAVVHVDAVILSEYLNRYFRAEFNSHNEKPGHQVTRYSNFKDYRKSPDFQNVAQTAVSHVSRILCRCGSVIAARPQILLDDVTSILSKMSEGVSDFNDLLLADLCWQNGWKLVTDDADFTGNDYRIDILTHNKRILSQA